MYYQSNYNTQSAVNTPHMCKTPLTQDDHEYFAWLMNEFGVSCEEAYEFKSTDTGWAHIDMNRVSRVLVIQLASALANRTFSTYSVTDVIQRLEGVSPYKAQKKDDQPFRKEPLKGLWHSHYSDPRHLLQNLQLETESERRVKHAGNLAQIAHKKTPDKKGGMGHFLHEFIYKAYLRRHARGSMTGEWLVSAKHEGENYYLCIATHTRNTEEDEAIVAFLRESCAREFPFLNHILDKDQ